MLLIYFQYLFMIFYFSHDVLFIYYLLYLVDVIDLFDLFCFLGNLWFYEFIIC